MRRAVKFSDSDIIKNQLKYISNNIANNKKINDILMKEQKMFCAYTDEFISRTDARDIEHFNPKLKNTDQDNYNNWFVVKHQWNKEKSYKWENFQPILHPTSTDFEKRIIYIDGDYFVNSNTDIEAQNCIDLLKLDDSILAEKRKKYIARKKEEIKVFDQNAEIFFATLLSADPCQVSYPRAIKEEFNVDLLRIL